MTFDCSIIQILFAVKLIKRINGTNYKVFTENDEADKVNSAVIDSIRSTYTTSLHWLTCARE